MPAAQPTPFAEHADRPVKILSLRRGALGDTLLWLPVLQALRIWSPAAALTFAGGGEYAQLLAAYGAVDAALSAEDLELWALGLAAAGERARARLAAYDCIVADLDPSEVGLLSAPVVTVDPVLRGGVGPAATELLTRVRAALPSLPAVEPAACLTRQRAAFDPQTVVLHPGSGSLRKCWPLTHWQHLASELLVLRMSVKVALGDAEVERGMTGVWPPGVQLLVRLPLRALAAHIAAAAAFVGHDSGPTHLAAALRVPTVALFGATDARVWAPPHPWVTVLDSSRDQHLRALVGAVRASAGQG